MDQRSLERTSVIRSAGSVPVAAVEEFLYREARLLDAQIWDEWLELYCEDAVFWVPAVTMAGTHTTDAENSLNFVYIAGRVGLQARVFRVSSGGSLASNPLPRTRHMIGGVMIDSENADELRAFANAQAVAFCEARGQQILTSSYEYTLRKQDGGLRIAQKKIMLLEYVIDGYFDFYTI
jgi:3-phenylpropionate/cinnamic acid dioxygenase small subunit